MTEKSKKGVCVKCKRDKPKKHPQLTIDEIKLQLPADYKDKFGERGFLKYTQSYWPVLIVNPCQASGPGQKLWLEYYHKVKGDPKCLLHLFRWYGKPLNEIDSYTLGVPVFEMIPYEEGVQVGIHEIPDYLAKKLASLNK